MLKFSLGKVVITTGAMEVLDQGKIQDLIWKHANLDFGDTPPQDVQMNMEAIETKDRIMSSYKIGKEKIWVITDAGHEVTTILLPEEY